jgi:hypothetical protein
MRGQFQDDAGVELFCRLVMAVEQVIQTAAITWYTYAGGFFFNNIVGWFLRSGDNYSGSVLDHLQPLYHPAQKALPEYRQHYLPRQPARRHPGLHNYYGFNTHLPLQMLTRSSKRRFLRSVFR